MLTVYLCDGDPRAVHVYSDLITRIAETHGIPITLSVFESGESLLFQLTGDPHAPNIIYLDAVLPQGSGVEVAREARDMGCEAQIVFNASSAEYVFDAFDVTPVQYLLKGSTTQARFEEVFLRACDLAVEREGGTFVVANRYEQRVIPYREIPYFEIRDRIVTVHYGEDKTFSFYETMEGLQKRLAGKDLIRIHRSYLVNAAHIEKFRAREVVLKNGKVLPLGVTHAATAKEEFLRYVSAHNVAL